MRPGVRSVLLSWLALLVALALAACDGQDKPDDEPSTPADDGPGAVDPFAAGWEETVVEASQDFRGLAAVSDSEAWVAGEDVEGDRPQVLRTTDGGETWDDVTPPDSAGLSFREVEVHDGVAHVLAVGYGQNSRILRSSDGGASWATTFRNDDDDAFYACLDLYPDGRRGLAVASLTSGPAGDGGFRILLTDDAGESWRLPPAGGIVPAVLDRVEAVGGGCLVTVDDSAFVITSGETPRVLRSDDYGSTWTATPSRLRAGATGGGAAGAFASPRQGIVVGGDQADSGQHAEAASFTRDGRRWEVSTGTTHVSEDVALLSGFAGAADGQVAISTGDVGLSVGSSLSTDAGASWTRVSDLGYHTVDCAGATCWAAGSGGRVGHN
ncbi:oxidoreductase [Nocardioides sp. GXZ039]|uniref:oxidoreductase n=1 Tax=Nocardioides sp. GXZ039 TaxID=3136018 RepID=UPI0030F39F90